MSGGLTPEALLLERAGEILLLVEPGSLLIRAASAAAMRQLGYREEELVGRPVTDVECALADVFFWEEVRNGGSIEVRDVEGLYQCADGSTLTAVKSVERIAGEPGWLVVRARNIAEQKRAEEALASLTSQLRATLEATVDGILMLDRDRRIVNMNRRFAQLWKVPEELLLTHDDARILAHLVGMAADEKSFRARLAQLPPTEDGESFDTLKLRDDRVIECKSRPARHAEQIIGRVFCFTDVTERFRAQLALITARDEAKAASRAKSEFLAMMSHEIRTPMNGIVGMAQLLEGTPLDEEQREYADTIRRSSEALLEIINDILDYSKIEARKLQLEQTAFDLHHLVSDVEKLFAVGQRESGLAFTIRFGPDVPRTLVGDPVRLRQVLVNLVGNAFKFTRQGSIEVAVTVLEAPAEAVRLRFAVHDTGIGIAADKLERIFTPFEQADMSTTRRYGGTGLGLSICRMLSEMMGGEIGVNSEPGRGSEFWFTALLAPPRPGLEVPALQEPQTERRNLRPDTRVLVVEDNVVNLTVLGNLLRKLGAQHIVTAVNGREAVARCAEQDFDLIFMDTRMPEMDGLEATQALRSAGLRTHIVGVSADAMNDDRQRALESGMNDYLTKPVSLDALRQGIENWRAAMAASGRGSAGRR